MALPAKRAQLVRFRGAAKIARPSHVRSTDGHERRLSHPSGFRHWQSASAEAVIRGGAMQYPAIDRNGRAFIG